MTTAVLALALLATTGGAEWTVDSSDLRCIATRPNDPAKTVSATQVAAAPLTGSWILALTVPASVPVEYDDPIVIEIAGTSRRIKTSALPASIEGGYREIGFKVPRDVLATDQRLRVTLRGHYLAELASDEFRPALPQLPTCEREMLEAVGVDLTAVSKLTRYPEPIQAPALLFGPNDYPADAVRAGAQGRVMARLTVDQQGRPAACTVVSSSGNASLDNQTCTVLLTRARFQPAQGPQGRPVSAPHLVTIRWSI